jgi:hypothetical protein
MLQTSLSETSVELVRDTTAALFVINLCASTTPVALAHPANAELKRFTFFVTRRREEGRERFRLHMGYFDNLAAAEEMLAAVRDVYPAAWAGPAPENRAPSSRMAARPAVAAVPAPVVVEQAVAPAAASVGTPVPAVVVAAPAPEPAPAPVEVKFELETMSNVREVLAQLADTPSAPRPMPVAAPVIAPVAAPIPKPVAAPKLALAKPALKVPPRSVVPTLKEAPSLTASQTLRVLESARAELAASGSPETHIEVLTPDDTQTLRDIKLDAQRNAPASYAVQLIWAVQPIDMETLPHLAIFDAYTLYHVEGNRQGRRWYGLRLGFFTDSAAAKQVAQYVRSEYTSVAVVPVTGKERDGARPPAASADAPPPVQQRPDAAKIPTIKPLEKSPPRAGGLEGFELLPDQPVAAKRDLDDVMSAAPAGGRMAGRPAAKVPAKVPGKPTGKRVVVRAQTKPSPPGAPQPLESTLEILGASTLTLDQSREIINDSAIRNTGPQRKEKAGRFSRLLSRLSDRISDG